MPTRLPSLADLEGQPKRLPLLGDLEPAVPPVDTTAAASTTNVSRETPGGAIRADYGSLASQIPGFLGRAAVAGGKMLVEPVAATARLVGHQLAHTPQEPRQQAQDVGTVVGSVAGGLIAGPVSGKVGGGLLGEMLGGAAAGGTYGAVSAPFGAYAENRPLGPVLAERTTAGVIGGALGGAAVRGGRGALGYARAAVQSPPIQSRLTDVKEFAKNFTIPSEVRLARTEGGKEIQGMFLRAHRKGRLAYGKAQLELKRAGIGSTITEDSPEDIALGEALRGVTKPEALPENLRPTYDVLHRMREQDIAQTGRQYGLNLYRKNYFPQTMATLEDMQLGLPGAKRPVREAMIRRVMKEEGWTREQAEADLQSTIATVETGHKADMGAVNDVVRRQQLAHDRWEATGRQGPEPPRLDPEDVVKMIQRRGQESLRHPMGELVKERVLNTKWYDPSVVRAFPSYMQRAHSELALMAETGPKMEKVYGILNKMDPVDQHASEHYTRVLQGSLSEEPTSAGGHKMFRRLAASRMSFPSSIANRQQSLNTLVATDLPSWTSAVKAAKLGKTHGDEAYDFALEAGVIGDDALNQPLALRGIGERGSWTRNILRRVGFVWAETKNRIESAWAGKVYAQRLTAQLQKDPTNEGVRYMMETRLGLDPDTILKRGLTHDDELMAAGALTDYTQFASRNADLPEGFTSSQWGRDVALFKGFEYQQGKFLLRTLADRKVPIKNRLAALTTLSTLGYAGADVTRRVRDLWSGRTRTEEDMAPEVENILSMIPIAGSSIQSARYGNLAEAALGPVYGPMLDAGGRVIAQPTAASTKRTLTRLIPQAGSMLPYRLYPRE